MHTHTQSKAKLTTAVAQLIPPSDNTGMSGITQTLEHGVADPPGTGLLAHRETAQVLQMEVAEPKAPQRPHTA